MFGWTFPSANFSGVDSIYLLTRLAALLPPGLATLAVQLSNQRFVIYVPLIIIATVIAIIVAGSGCAPITIIEVAAVQRTRGAIRFIVIVFQTAQNIAVAAVAAVMKTNAAYIIVIWDTKSQ